VCVSRRCRQLLRVSLLSPQRVVTLQRSAAPPMMTSRTLSGMPRWAEAVLGGSRGFRCLPLRSPTRRNNSQSVYRGQKLTRLAQNFHLNYRSRQQVGRTMPPPWYVRIDGRTTRKHNASGPIYRTGTVCHKECRRGAHLPFSGREPAGALNY